MTDYIAIRHNLHEHPQTAGNEQYAHDTIVKHLQGLHPDKVYTHVGGYGVIAVWEGVGHQDIKTSRHQDDGSQSLEDSKTRSLQYPTIAFRADTDALSIGHRCGHDGHTTILLRLAELVDGQRVNRSTSQRETDAGLVDSLTCRLVDSNILLLWQPAEETGEGARAVIESGILQQYNIKAIYGLHNLPGYPLGTVVLCPHTFAAASTGVVYHLDGRETHASTPELGVNPGLAIAEIIDGFDGLNGKDGEFRQSTLICVRVGEPAFGTSAGHGEVMFTLRAFTNDAMKRLLVDANNTVDVIAARYGLTVSRTLVEPFRATENNPECVGKIREAIKLNTDHYTLHTKEMPFRWSEDFAEYLLHWPGAMFGIGSGERQPELHRPDYDFPDELVEPAAQLFLKIYQSFSPA